jgi:protein TonB
VAGAQLAMSRAAGLDYRFGAALTASLAAHAAAMTLSLPAPQRAPFAPFEAPMPLQVRLLESPLLAPELTKPVAETSVPAKRVPRKQATAPTARTDSPPPAPPATTHTLEAPDEAPAPVPAPSALPAGPPSPEQARPPVAAYAATSRAPAPELFSGYGKMISQALARHKEYPRIAQMRGWEGSVTMRLRVAQSGHLIDAELHTSSGHDVLDKQALAMASQAQRLPVPPDGLSGGEVAVLVPIVFRLERERVSMSGLRPHFARPDS